MSYHTNISLNATDITEIENVKVTDVKLDSLPEVVLSQGKLSRNDGVKIYNREYAGKSIVIEGHITASSREGYLNTRDELLKATEGTNLTLQAIIDNLPLEYTVTMENVIFSDSSGGYGAFSIQLIASDPFGYDRDARTIINGTTVTSASSDLSFSEAIGGSYKTPLSVTISVVSVTGGTGKYIDLTNQSGINIRVTRDWSNDDTLVIDFKNKTCRVNGARVDYNGSFWNAEVGDLNITYSDNFTTRTVGVLATYKRRRL